MAFDPETAYAGDYQYIDRVKDVTWEHGSTKTTGLKGRWSRINIPDVLSVSANLGLSSEASTVVVWEPKPSDVTDWVPKFAPKPGDMLRIDETRVGWLIKDATRTPFQGRWVALVDKEVTNG